MPTRGASGSIPAAVQDWRMVAPVATRSTATAGKSGRRPCQPSDVLRPVRQPLLAQRFGPCGHESRRKGEQGQTARRRFRRHVVKPDRYQFPERAAKDQVALGAWALYEVGAYRMTEQDDPLDTMATPSDPCNHWACNVIQSVTQTVVLARIYGTLSI